MKKFYFLFLLLITLSLSAQTTTTINFDTAANWTTLGSGYSSQVYSEGLFSFTSNSTLRETSGTQDGFDRTYLDSQYSVRLRNNATSSLTFNIASGGVDTFSVQVRRWDGSPSPDFSLEYSIDGTTWTNVATINNTTLSDSSDYTLFSGTINNINDNIQIRFISNGTTERIMVDEFTWTAPTLSTENFETTEFTVYPNPASNGFVNITTASNEAINVSVFDVLGKKVLSQTINNRLNVSTLKSGVYILNLNQNGATTTKKLVIK